VGAVLPPSSLLHLLHPLVPPPTPLAQMLRRVLMQLHRRPWLVARNAQLASARIASAAVAGTAALNAWGARVAATMCSIRVRNIFRAINAFGGIGGCYHTCASRWWSSNQMQRVHVSKRTERALRLLRPPSIPPPLLLLLLLQHLLLPLFALPHGVRLRRPLLCCSRCWAGPWWEWAKKQKQKHSLARAALTAAASTTTVTATTTRRTFSPPTSARAHATTATMATTTANQTATKKPK
jgi:hypothetical protein